MERCDLVVLGSGPAGQKAAIQAAKLHKRVAMVERREVVGGVSINTGTIPSKTLREAILYLWGYRERGFYGDSYRVKEDITMPDLLARAQHVMRRESDVVRDQMARNHVRMVHGEASFRDPHTVRVVGAHGEEDLVADFIVIATGTVPAHPPSVDFTDPRIIDSDGLLGLPVLPRSMIVVGAGVVGIEYATIFATAGVEVTLIDKRSVLLDFVDNEIVEALKYHARSHGVSLRLGDEVARLGIPEGTRTVAAELASGKRVYAEAALIAAGREGATGPLNLAAAGISADGRGRIPVDANFRTAAPNIFAVGDVIGFHGLASTSMEQGRLAACHAFGAPATGIPELFPFGIYTVPEISMVGRNEEELTAAGVPYEVGTARYREIARGAILGDEVGMLKILCHADSRRLLGVHAIGEGVTEIIHIGQAVLAFGGTLDYFVDSVFNYPTLAECYKVAALDAMNKLSARERPR